MSSRSFPSFPITIKVPAELKAHCYSGHGSSHKITSAIEEGGSGKNGKDKLKRPCELYAAPLTIDHACTCPHLEAYLPTRLDVDDFNLPSSGGIAGVHGDGGKIGTPKAVLAMSDLHFASLYSKNDEGTETENNNEDYSKSIESFNAKCSSQNVKSMSSGENGNQGNSGFGGITKYYSPLFSGLFNEQPATKIRCIEHGQQQGKNDTIKKETNTKKESFAQELKHHQENMNTKTNDITRQPTQYNHTQELHSTTIATATTTAPVIISSKIDQKAKKKSKKKRSRNDSTTSNTSSVGGDNFANWDIFSDPNQEILTFASDNHKSSSSTHSNYQTLSSAAQKQKSIQKAVIKVEQWLEVIRQNRLRFWRESQQKNLYSNYKYWNGSSKQQIKGNVLSCCKYCHKKKKNDESLCDLPSGDELMECLDCSFIACGPSSTSCSYTSAQQRQGKRPVRSKQHLLQHFLLSGHSMGITCGPKGDIYCMKCGDFVSNHVFDREKERVDIQMNAPWLGWERTRITRRGFGFSDSIFDDFLFIPDSHIPSSSTPNRHSDGVEASVVVPVSSSSKSDQNIHGQSTTVEEGTIIWRGFRATYPVDVPNELIEAGRATIQRIKMFQDSQESYHTSSKNLQHPASTVEVLPIDNSSRRSDNHQTLSIHRPVGFHNMGNTCYLSCVLQCLINLYPMQKYFLYEAKHHYQSCKALRSLSSINTAHDDETCIACETDLLFLEYFGSVSGINAISAMQNDNMIASDGCSGEKKPNNPTRGLPVAPTRLLVELWKSKGMSLLAGYEQRDAHEFLQAFLDIISKDCRQFHTSARRIRKMNMPKQLNDAPLPINEPEADIVKSLFGGILRSVLICEKCGYKRSQSEAFLNVSIPLDKELISKNDGESSEGTATRSAIKIDLKACLEKFVSVESLSDTVHCEWCNTKTSTQKQHTFAKVPKILCLHLQRFDATRNRKIDEPVSFPSQLDMGPYFPQWREVEQKNVMRGTNHGLNAHENDNTAPQLLYDLCSTIDHSGTLYQGHYIANVKVDADWYHCNDSFVSASDEEEVLKSNEVYMMFYMRR